MWGNGAYELCLALALCHHPLYKETCKPFLGAAYCRKHNHVFSG